MSFLRLTRNAVVRGSVAPLPSSKSISNRALMLDALCGGKAVLHNLSTSSDTRQMQAALATSAREVDVRDAGTAMRFLTAYFTLCGAPKVMTGTPRMRQRPIGPLVAALNALGGDLVYLGEEGFPPVEIRSFSAGKTDRLSLPGDVSSQYISALMMIAPRLPQGLVMQLQGTVRSRPYIRMTASLMALFGASSAVRETRIAVAPQPYRPATLTVEPDWSAIGYWLALTALADTAHIRLEGVLSQSLQGDRVVVDIMSRLGVHTAFERGDVVLRKKADVAAHLEWDFSDCPDLAQTVLPVCALKGISGKFRGMDSLRIKETDRIAALQTELAKVGAELSQAPHGVFILRPGTWNDSPHTPLPIATYNDHRMAMGLACWAAVTGLEVQDPDVVEKSYPAFWRHLKGLGFQMERVAT